MGDTKRITLFFIVSTLLWFLRMVLPGIKYLFIPVMLVLLVAISLYYYRTFRQQNFILEFLKTFTPLLLLALFYLWGIIYSGKITQKNSSDLFEFVVVLFFLAVYYILMHSAKNPDTFKFIFRKLANLIGLSSMLVAILGFIKYAIQNSGYEFPFETPMGTSINTDKNFYALYSFLGIISFIPRFTINQHWLKSTWLQMLVIILLANIFFSFSYRAMLILAAFLGFIILIQILFCCCKRIVWIKYFARNTRLMILLLILVFAGAKSEYLSQNKVINQVNHHAQLFLSKSSELSKQAFHFEKWEYAIEMFGNQSFNQKLFGNGFHYLANYGETFYNDATRFDYPHNPILSALLYSGIIGAIFAFLFLFISVYYGLLYFYKYPLYALMLFVSFIFVFFSGNSLFSVPVFLFLFSLSFLIRHQEITDLHIDMNLEKPGSRLLKESFDYMVGTLFFVILLPVLALFALLVLITLGWPVFYTQKRVGQNGKTFYLHKFRTMRKHKSATTIAAVEIDRVTVLGAFMRKYKIDELPELWNIIRGDMSFVGPRPDVPGYADKLTGTDRAILALKPGLTGPASLKYIDEEVVLSKKNDPQMFNDEVIFPDKVRINLNYMKYWSLLLDFKIIIFTLLRKKLNDEYFK